MKNPNLIILMKRTLIIVLAGIILLAVDTVLATGGLQRRPEEDLSYAPGEVIVKFKDEEAAEKLNRISEGKIAATALGAMATIDSSFNELFSKYGIAEAKRLFKTLEQKSLSYRMQSVHAPSIGERIKQKFPARATRAYVGSRLPHLENIYILKFKNKSVDVVKKARQLSEEPNVEYAEPNYRMGVFATPNDPFMNSSGSWGQSYPDLWGLKNIQAEQAWDISTGSSEVVVAVVDTGVNYSHPDIAENIWVNEGEIPNNGIDDDGNSFVDDVRGWDFYYEDNNPTDGHGHGTHVSGTIAAVTDNGEGIAGISWHSRIMAVKGLSDSGSGYADQLANGLQYAADNGADVISNSWGGRGWSDAIADAVDYAHSLGCVVVAAAGNSNEDAFGFTPANVQNVITVAASNHNDRKASFSNWGTKIDVAAPGGDGTEEDDGANYLGRNILSLRAAGTDMYGDSICIFEQDYYRCRGTSMACPHVSGLAALILSKHPEFTNEQVRQVIRISADDIVDPLGDGADYAGFDIYMGFGRINAYKALQIDSILTARITYPVAYKVTSGIVDVIGTASGFDFQYYKLEFGQGLTPTEWTEISYSFTEVNDGILGTWDANLIIPGVLYTLRLQVVDNNFNTFEDRVTVISSLPAQEGWPVQIGEGLFSSPMVADLTDSPGLELIIGSLDNKVYCFTSEGNLLEGWPKETQGDVLSTPAVADLDSDEDLEIIVGSSDGKMYIWHHDGTEFSGWPRQTGAAIVSSPAVGDLDGDGDLEIVVGSYDKKIYAFHHEGSLVEGPLDQPEGWPYTTGGRIVSSPALGDIDSDGDLEVVIGSCDGKIYALHHDGILVDGWPFETDNEIVSSPALADLDGNSGLEVAIGSNDNKIYLLHHDGTVASGWPIQTQANVESSPSIADLDGDGYLDVVVGSSDNYIYALHHDGVKLNGWPVETGGYVISSCAVADIDGDGNMELVVGSLDRKAYAFNHNGLLVTDWPVPLEDVIECSPTIADMDGDGDVEVVVAGWNGRIFAWDLSSPYLAEDAAWDFFRHDLHHTGLAEIVEAPTPIDLPSQEAYGNIEGGNQSHISKIVYNFTAVRPGGLKLSFEALSIKFSDEVQISINDSPMSYVPRTTGSTWSDTHVIALPSSLFIDTDSPNALVFDNTYNPPANYQWGIRNVHIIEPLVSPPTVDEVASPTNQTILTLSGTKAPQTSIWINGIETAPLDSLENWTSNFTLTEGQNHLIITAKDAALNESDPVFVDIILDTQIPTVSFSNIVDGQFLNSSLNVIAETSDNLEVTKVEFYLGTDLQKTDEDTPYVWLWDVNSYTDAPYTLKAVAYDTTGNTADAIVNVIVDTAAPSISITSPPDGTVYFGD